MSKTTDSLAAVIAWLAGHPDWPYTLHGLELPAGWQPSPTALALPDGGNRGLDLPVITPALSFWCYGRTPEEARDVADVLCGLVHRSGVMKVTLSAGEVYVGPGEVLTEPLYLREPETLWHRWIVRARVRVSETPVQVEEPEPGPVPT